MRHDSNLPVRTQRLSLGQPASRPFRGFGWDISPGISPGIGPGPPGDIPGTGVSLDGAPSASMCTSECSDLRGSRGFGVRPHSRGRIRFEGSGSLGPALPRAPCRGARVRPGRDFAAASPRSREPIAGDCRLGGGVERLLRVGNDSELLGVTAMTRSDCSDSERRLHLRLRRVRAAERGTDRRSEEDRVGRPREAGPRFSPHRTAVLQCNTALARIASGIALQRSRLINITV